MYEGHLLGPHFVQDRAALNEHSLAATVCSTIMIRIMITARETCSCLSGITRRRYSDFQKTKPQTCVVVQEMIVDSNQIVIVPIV